MDHLVGLVGQIVGSGIKQCCLQVVEHFELVRYGV